MRKPVPEDFSITTEEYKRIEANDSPWEPTRVAAIVVLSFIAGVATFLITEQWKTGFNVFWLTLLGISFVSAILVEVIKRSHPLYRKAKLYREAEAAYFRTLEEHWMSLTGTQFEAEMESLYTKLGYKVESTPVSDDKGVDLILKKDDKTIIVQCKAHKKPVGPAIVRELYGTLMHAGADSAILASTGGFTRGVRTFVLGKPIKLISSADLITMAQRIGEREEI